MSGVYDAATSFPGGPWAPGTIVVVQSLAPAVGLFVADPDRPSLYLIPGLRFLRMDDGAVVTAWMEAEGVARVASSHGRLFAMAPDTLEKAMAVRLRWR